jgi:ADP-heptose:LPS heptosyltransferase
LGALPNIGVVWSSGEWNPSRSIPFEHLAPILSRNDCQYWNLQGGPLRNQWRSLSHPGLCDSPLLADSGLVPLAAVIAQLDLVITVDTLSAHLAGALNIPCFLLLQHRADWRWMVDRNDSPWYRSLRLLRQSIPGDWPGLIRNLDCALGEWIAARAGERTIA